MQTSTTPPTLGLLRVLHVAFMLSALIFPALLATELIQFSPVWAVDDPNALAVAGTALVVFVGAPVVGGFLRRPRPTEIGGRPIQSTEQLFVARLITLVLWDAAAVIAFAHGLVTGNSVFSFLVSGLVAGAMIGFWPRESTLSPNQL